MRTKTMATTKSAVPAAPRKRTPAKAAAKKADVTTKTTVEKAKEQVSAMASEAGGVARKAANTGKAKAVEGLGSAARVADEAAKTIDQHFGATYGDYARKASEGINKAATSLDSKEVDQLIADATDFVKKNPVVAVGAAAALGFVLTRLLRGSSSE
jgi:ElaB/YqjD/DUF883 family membrane-anchored ribosome-binding protein